MKLKKLTTLVLSSVMVASLISGCGSKATTGGDSAEGLTDGTYKATYDFVDGHGWKPQLEIVVKDKKITNVTFDYTNPAGELKSKNEGYNKAMKATSGTNPEEFSPKLAEALVTNQDPDKVDVITGATHSSETFKEMSKVVLEKAAKGDTSETVLSMNDTYTASEKELDDHGWKAQLSLTYEDGKLTKVDYEEVDKDGNKKSESQEYADKMKEASGITPSEAYTKLEEAAVAGNEIDVVTGATHATDKFKALFEEASAMRK